MMGWINHSLVRPRMTLDEFQHFLQVSSPETLRLYIKSYGKPIVRVPAMPPNEADL